jgi:ligand-binding SRPBCC domain-containing protein
MERCDMAVIQLTTLIGAPRERVFDLARSIDAHQKSTERTRERAIAGVTTGLIGMNDEVTWEARHLGIRQRLTVRVTAFDRPSHFQDVIVRGAFKRMVHDHTFVELPPGTQMIDRFEFESPFGILGWLVDGLFLGRYMRQFLAQRNRQLKVLAESEDWRKYLEHDRGAKAGIP